MKREPAWADALKETRFDRTHSPHHYIAFTFQLDAFQDMSSKQQLDVHCGQAWLWQHNCRGLLQADGGPWVQGGRRPDHPPQIQV